MKFAIIQNGLVVNIAEADEAFGLSQGWISSGVARIGDMWDGQVFSAPAPVATPEDYKAINRNSYKARLRGKAATASKNGDTATAMKLLLKASEV